MFTTNGSFIRLPPEIFETGPLSVAGQNSQQIVLRSDRRTISLGGEYPFSTGNQDASLHCQLSSRLSSASSGRNIHYSSETIWEISNTYPCPSIRGPKMVT